MLLAILLAVLAAVGAVALIQRSSAGAKPKVGTVSWLLAGGLIALIAGLLLTLRGAWVIGAPLVAAGAAALWRHKQLKALVAGPAPRPLPPAPDMTPSEAAQILGVSEEADDETIRAAHRKLINALHPDQGGTDYLAAKINQARDVLLARFSS
jgi:hypothetical protein